MRCVLLVFLAGCATGYQEKGAVFGNGYSEVAIGDGKFTVDFVGNKFTDLSDVIAYVHRRAAELCPGGFDELDSHVERRTNGKSDAVMTVRCRAPAPSR